MSKRLNKRNPFRTAITVRDLKDYVEGSEGKLCGLLEPFAAEKGLDLKGIKKLISKYSGILCSCNYGVLEEHFGLDYELPRREK